MVGGGGGGRCGWWWLVPLGKELNVLTPMVQQLTAECGRNFSREGTDKAVSPCRFQELIKALCEEETFSPIEGLQKERSTE